MLFNQWKVNFSSKNENDFEETNFVNNMNELIKSFSTDLMPAFKLRNQNPQHIFDNFIGKYVAFIMMIQGLKPKNFEYNSYWLENEEFIKIIKENNIIFKDIEPIHVEYWFKDGYHDELSNQYHKDNNALNIPMFTSLLYLSDSMTPTLIFDKETNAIGLCFPECLKTVIFDGGKKIHGQYHDLYTDSGPRYIIALNVYDKPMKYTPCLDMNQIYQWFYMVNNRYPEELPTDLDIKLEKIDSKTIVNVEINSPISQFNDFHESLLKNEANNVIYQKYKYRILSEIDKYVKHDEKRAFNIHVNTNTQAWVMFDADLNNDNVTNDHIRKNAFNAYDKKYCNVFIEKSAMTNYTCEWLVSESNNQVKELYGEWKNDRHSRYPTYDISIDKLKTPVMNYILNFFMRTAGDLIYKSFNLSTRDYNLVIKEAFIVKYEENKQRYLEQHCDDCDISAIILLSSENSFSGGGTKFESGLCVNPDQGDMLLFGSKFKHEGIKINSGVRMILTFFINVTQKDN
jgi:hypothetical protein